VSDEFRQLAGTPHHILFVEDPFGESTKKAGGTVFQYLATRAQQCSVRINRAPEWEQINFTSAGTV
jgi:hypothetical protein